MRRTVFGGLALALVALIGFYVVWPAWTGYRIKTALDTRDPALLSQKIDFDSVRTSLTPLVAAKVDEQIDARIAQMGPLAQAFAPKLKKDIAPKIAELALAALVTPEAMIRIASEGGNIKESIERIMREQLSKMGGVPDPVRSGDTPDGTMPSPATLGGVLAGIAVRGRKPADVPAEPAVQPSPTVVTPSATQAKPKFSIANIKRFAMTGLASFVVGVNRDTAATEPELTAAIAFRGGDWKVVGITPKI